MPKVSETPKQRVQAMLRGLPDDLTYDEIQYHIYVLQRIEDGVAAIDRGEPTLTTGQIRRRLARAKRRWTVRGPRAVEGAGKRQMKHPRGR